MSTNFYIKPIPTVKEKKELLELLNDDNFDEVASRLNEYEDNKIHLGKRTDSFYFLFDSNPILHQNNQGYELTKESFYDWLCKKFDDGWVFENDNYDTEVNSPETFIKMVEEWNSHKNNHLSKSNYHKYFSDYRNSLYWESYGYKVENDEIINDGLRWSIDSNWS